ncbi:cleavage and polyadenylation specificity factor subunit 4, partial [Phenoliferia sp. Uapishka_3]
MATILDTRPTFAHIEFNIEPYIKQDLGIKLDADSLLCRDHLTEAGCPLGVNCPLRHTTPSPLNFLPPTPVPTSAHARTVCKHWLRGLCKKGNSCEFMHEYNMRKMAEVSRLGRGAEGYGADVSPV